MNTSSMYFNKFSSGTILALLALSGMLFLVPLAVPVHATNGSPLQYSITSGSPLTGGVSSQSIVIQVTNPSSNAYAVTAITITVPSGWTLNSCSETGHYFENCVSSSTSSTFYTFSGSTSTPLSPGASDTV